MILFSPKNIWKPFLGLRTGGPKRNKRLQGAWIAHQDKIWPNLGDSSMKSRLRISISFSLFFKHKHFVKHDLLVISRTESFFYLLLFSCYKSKTAKIAIVYLFRAITPTRSGLTTSNQLKLLSSFKSEEQKSLRISCIYKFSRKK